MDVATSGTNVVPTRRLGPDRVTSFGARGSREATGAMTSKEERAREIQRSIGEVLLRDWDPVGVRDEPKAQGEYDAYVGGVYKLIAAGATARELAEHLGRVEAEHLGLKDADPKKLIRVAEKLLKLNVTR